MSSCWVVCPSARPVEHVAKWAAKWHERGYKVALWRDDPHEAAQLGYLGYVFDFHLLGQYPGYAVAQNALIAEAISRDDKAEWFVCAGDDIEPDAAHTAEEIAAQCGLHFATTHAGPDAAPGVAISVKSIGAALHGIEHATLGVMQPTGDRWTEDHHGSACVDRVASSAWIGREFALRVNQGNGPLWPEYTHMFVDEELQEVATRLGVFWQRRDLIHLHNHWQRPKGVTNADCPPHLLKVNTSEHWRESKEIFMRRKRAGFPGSELK